MLKTPIILASTSEARQKLLLQAGIPFTAVAPQCNEREEQKILQDRHYAPLAMAQKLAQLKSLSVQEHFPDQLILGGDQVLEYEGKSQFKVNTKEALKKRLLAWSGTTHMLHTAICLSKNGNIVFEYANSNSVKMSHYTEAFIESYIKNYGNNAIKSVGGYQLEGPGIQLIETIEGDYFSILGLPLFPLLKVLRQ